MINTNKKLYFCKKADNKESKIYLRIQVVA